MWCDVLSAGDAVCKKKPTIERYFIHVCSTTHIANVEHRTNVLTEQKKGIKTKRIAIKRIIFTVCSTTYFSVATRFLFDFVFICIQWIRLHNFVLRLVSCREIKFKLRKKRHTETKIYLQICKSYKFDRISPQQVEKRACV